MTGRLVDLGFSMNRKQRVTVEVDEDFREQFDKLKDCALDIKIKKASKKRGLDANAYYWKLVGELAKHESISSPRCHNLMLRRYGALEEFDGKAVYIVLPDTDEAEKKADESETYHLKPTSQVKEGKDGKLYRTWMLLKGSSGFNTAEMSRLISGLRDECRQVGIPYETPDEIARIVSLMEGK